MNYVWKLIDFSWLTGPIFEKELRISSRRRRNYVLRFAYLALLTMFLALIWGEVVRYTGSALYQSSRMAEAGKIIIAFIVWFQFCATQLVAIIMLSTSMQGQTGPYFNHPGSGHKLTALAGFSNILGWPDRSPGWMEAYTDFIAPRYNIIAIMAALEYRRRTGKGQYLDMSQYEAGIQFMAPLVLDYAVNKRIANRMGNQCSYAAPHNAYRCQGEDRWCAIAVFTYAGWQSFCEVIGNPALAEDPRFVTLLARKENEEELDKLVNEWTISRSAEEVMNMMQAAGVAAGVVATGEDLLDHDPQFKHRQTFVELEYPGIGKYRTQIGAHFMLSKYTCELKPAPLLGEHNEYVFKEILGMPDDEYDKLVKEEVIC